MLLLLLCLLQDNSTLQLNAPIKPGMNFVIDESQRVAIRLTQGEKVTDSVLDLSMDVKHSVKANPRSKGFTIDRQWTRVRINNPNTLGNKFAEMVKLFDGAVFQVDVDEQGKVTQVVGYDSLLKRVERKKPEWLPAIQQFLPRELCDARQTAFLLYLPYKSIRLEEKWARNDGTSPDYNLTRNFKLTKFDVDKGIATISGDIAVMPQAKNPELKQTASGSIHILHNQNRNCVQYLEEKLQIKMNQDQTVLELNTTLVLRLLQ